DAACHVAAFAQPWRGDESRSCGTAYDPRGIIGDRRSSTESRRTAWDFAAHAEPQAQAVRIGAYGSRFMNVPVREMRREQRRKAEGAVRVSFANPKPVQIEGRL